ncbi:uncharacterized protein LOC103397869 isoform X2 [Cynoglossus semilaevis]|uniref:uncharacterized protein LOC103397869 isoform X2 n=1 Tax=Cynoglossus semilaevis TaxID=244447 RepID=UPI000494EE51|nr:uncharacterized protein LOC103397869 isoform X2 [Cynoglossus semilaevis]
MLDDEVTQGIIEDKILLQFGEQMFHFYSGDRRRREYMRQNLRQLSRLVLEARKTTPLKNLEDFFYPSSFRHVVSAVKVVAGYNAETKMFKIPSLAVKLGYHLQKACSIVESNALKLGDKDLAKSAQNFLSVYQRKWNMLVSSGALSNMNESKMNTDKMVPLVQDVKLLYSHLEKVHEVVEKDLRDNVTQENYVTLAKVMIARMFFFNRRKASEISSITLRNFMSRKKCDVLDEMDVSVTDLERTLCSYFTRVDMRGSCGRVVPVFLKPTFESALELLVKTRELCAVPKENIYLFGRPNAKSNFKGPKSVYQLAKECGVENLNTMTAKKIQKHFGKMLLWMNLNGEEVDQILGPNHQAHTIRAELETGEQAASPCYSEHSTFSCEQANQNYKQERGTPTVVQQKGKQKWEVAEVRAVERHLMHFITTHKVPQKNDCIQCLEAEPQSLKTRSWKGVKDYVRNRITALKRESNRSEHAPKNEKKPRREEQEEDDL